MMRRFFIRLTCAVLLCALLSACRSAAPEPSAVPAPAAPTGAALLTIDGHPVETGEYRLFLQGERALAAAYFGARYGAQVDDGFWTREYGGQTPEAYAKQAALERLTGVKMEAILLCERGLLSADAITYSAFLAELERANAQRAAQLARGEILYGLTEYDAATYYSYLAARRHGELLRSQIQLTAPTREQLRGLYDADPAQFAGEIQLTCRVRYEDDGTEEELALSPKTIGKENTEGQRLYDALREQQPGAVLGGMTLNERPVEATLVSLTQGEALTFEEAGDLLRAAWAERELAELLAGRAGAADVVLDRAAYDAIGVE